MIPRTFGKRIRLFDIDGVDWMEKESTIGSYARMKGAVRGKMTISTGRLPGDLSKTASTYRMDFRRKCWMRLSVRRKEGSATSHARNRRDPGLRAGACRDRSADCICFCGQCISFDELQHEDVVPIKETYQDCYEI